MERYRCENPDCGFYQKRKKSGKYSEERCHWQISTGEGMNDLPEDKWIEIRCPHCDYKKLFKKVDEPRESIIELFKGASRVEKNANT